MYAASGFGCLCVCVCVCVWGGGGGADVTGVIVVQVCEPAFQNQPHSYSQNGPIHILESTKMLTYNDNDNDLLPIKVPLKDKNHGRTFSRHWLRMIQRK